MLKQLSLYAVLVTLAAAGASLAQTIENARKDQPPTPINAGALTSYSLTFSGTEPVARSPGHALLTEIVIFLSSNFDLPAIHEHPHFAFVSPLKLASLRYQGILSHGSGKIAVDPAVQVAPQPQVLAVYHDQTKTVFLTEGWTGATPAEVSVVVHEMVHHLQNLGRVKYECPAGREKPAYLAQKLWLERFGTDLEDEFGIDMFTVLVKSACFN